MSTTAGTAEASDQRGVATLVVDLDRRVEGDRTRPRQVFENLVRNAIEHAGDDVTVTVGPLGGGFYVEDDGPGIPEAKRDDALETGYSTRDQGTGFGLSIVEAHGWSIEVTSGTDSGAPFEFTDVESARPTAFRAPPVVE